MELTLRDVAIILNLPIRLDRNTVRMTCPKCGHESLNFNFNKNVFNCNACGNLGGGVLDCWAFFRGINEPDKSEKYRKAKIDIETLYKSGLSEEELEEMEKNRQKDFFVPKTYDLLNIKELDYTYKALVSHLILEEKHRKHLINERGLSEEDIAAYDLRSVPQANLSGIASALLLKGCTLKGVPGFYKEDGKWTFVKYPEGILIPQKNAKGQIMGFQVRRDTSEKKKRFLALTSDNLEEGTKTGSYVHFASKNYDNIDIACVILTEGPLKADIINAFTNIPVLSIPGVNSQSHLAQILPELRARGLRDIRIAFDMDYKTNPNVFEGLNNLKRLLSNNDLSYMQLEWDPEFKGCDDYLKAKLFKATS